MQRKVSQHQGLRLCQEELQTAHKELEAISKELQEAHADDPSCAPGLGLSEQARQLVNTNRGLVCCLSLRKRLLYCEPLPLLDCPTSPPLSFFTCFNF